MTEKNDTTIDHREKSEALRFYLNQSDFPECEPEDITKTSCDNVTFEAFGREYAVLTDEEADEMARENILDSLWAFNADFILGYIEGDLDGREFEVTSKALQKMQGELCESANPIIRAMVSNRLEDFIKDAIEADGRAHFLNTYDNEEQESGDFFIYRTN